ncbi:MAG: alpha/beta hydrolase family protein [Candidatus Xenobia bacterium]
MILALLLLLALITPAAAAPQAVRIRDVPGLLVTPSTPGPWPAVLDLHGSGWHPQQNERNLEFWAAHGFLALDIDYMQDADAGSVPQVVAALKWLAARSRHVCLHGYSQGGRIALQAAVRWPHLAALSVMAGRVRLWDGTFPALLHADRLKCPVLLQQGMADTVIPPEDARLLAAALRRQGTPFECWLYRNETHRLDLNPAVLERAERFVAEAVGP